MGFRLRSEITQIETIARGTSVRIKHYLIGNFGYGNWRKMKGQAIVEYDNGQIWLVELHWFEAHGIGRKLMKDKWKIRRLA